MTPLDVNGTPIEPNATVVYAASAGRSPVLRTGRVVSVESAGKCRYTGRPTFKITVFSDPFKKNVFLHYPERMCVTGRME